jgi:hypothetical protein
VLGAVGRNARHLLQAQVVFISAFAHVGCYERYYPC